MTPRNKNRLILIGLALMFLVPMGAAFLMNAQGWRPQNTRNHGVLVEPPQDVSSVAVSLADGAKLVWRDPQWQWTLLALPGAQCGDACRTRLDEMLRMRITLGKNADRVRVLYLGPDFEKDYVAARAPLLVGHEQGDAFAKFRTPAADGLALALVDPNGLLMLHYPEGYQAAGVREDITRVLH